MVHRPTRNCGEVTAQALREHASGGLVSCNVPRRFDFIEELPRNALGKILRAQLSDH